MISSKRMTAESPSTSPDISWDLPPVSGKSNLNFRILAGLKELRVQSKNILNLLGHSFQLWQAFFNESNKNP